MSGRPLHEILSENLVRLTDERQISLAELADAAGLDRREFLEVLAGERDGDLDWLNRVAKVLGVGTADLIEERER